MQSPTAHRLNPNPAALCDLRLPFEALLYRRTHNFLTPHHLRRLNITAWLYQDEHGVIQKPLVNPNVPIQEIIRQFGRADTPDAEVGLHSEGIAAEWFRTQRKFRVLQIFTERIPCGPGRMNCAALLAAYFKGVPVYYYHTSRTYNGQDVAETLRWKYGLPPFK
jgi:hypothetical protein